MESGNQFEVQPVLLKTVVPELLLAVVYAFSPKGCPKVALRNLNSAEHHLRFQDEEKSKL